MDYSDFPFPRKQRAGFREISPSVHWAQRHTTRAKQEYPPRRIYDFELLYVLSGDLIAHIGNETLNISEGDLLFLSSGVIHYLEVLRTPKADFLGIHFDFFDELDIAIDEDIIVHEESPAVSRFCCEPELDEFEPLSAFPVTSPSSQIVRAMEQVIEDFTLRQPGYELMCRSGMLQIIGSLLRRQTEARKFVHPVHGESFLALSQWMNTHYFENVSNADLAKRVNLNEDYMVKKFKEAFGITPNRHLQKIRHQEAKKLLRESDESIEVIGTRVGYEDIHYFSRIFHKLEGIPPREYRKLSRIY